MLTLLSQLETYQAFQAELRTTPGSRSFHDLVIASTFFVVTIVIMVTAPLVVARTLAAERQHHTLHLLKVANVSDTSLLIGKFLALVILLNVANAILILSIASLGLFFPFDAGQIIASGLGLALTIVILVALTVALSAVIDSSVTIALIATALALSLAFFNGPGSLTNPDETEPVRYSLLSQLEPFFSGLVSLSFVAYSGILTVALLILARWGLFVRRVRG